MSAITMVFYVKMRLLGKLVKTSTSHDTIMPVGPVAKANWRKDKPGVWSVIVCTPSDNENAVGVTNVSGWLAGIRLDSVTIAVTKSLVV